MNANQPRYALYTTAYASTMDSHQGGDFTFDMNMDFSNVFGTKPNEGETSTDFFFGDEGIDTTASLMGSGLFPQQTAFHLQQDYVSRR